MIFGSSQAAFWAAAATWVVSLSVVPWVANYKGRSLLGWLVATFFVGLLALLVLLALPRAGGGYRRRASLDVMFRPEQAVPPARNG